MKPILFLFFIIFLYQPAFTQLTENFDSGHLKSWKGDTADFFINTQQKLQLNAPSGGQSFITNSLPGITDIMEWQFYIRQDFSPSSSNFSRFYLSGDSVLNNDTEGFYIQFGESGTDDAVTLILKTATEEITVARGNDGEIASNFALFVKVSKNKNGLWKIFTKISKEKSYDLKASGQNNQTLTGKYTGWYCNYTKTRKDKFFLDNIYAGKPVKDTLAPSLKKININSSNQLQLSFSEKLPASVIDEKEKFRYEYQKEVLHPLSIEFFDQDSTRLLLFFENDFPNGITNQFFIDSIKDRNGNIDTNGIEESFIYFRPYEPDFKDIIINEFLADPTPSRGLPEVEFVELYNRSKEIIDLKDFQIQDANSSSTLSSFHLYPDNYLILCDTEDTSSFAGKKNVLGVPGLPSLNNGGDLIALFDSSGKAIDSLWYNNDMYKETIKSKGGWSLELVNDEPDCKGLYLWRGSENPQGGTPGVINAVYDTTKDIFSPFVKKAELKNTVKLVITFNESLDTAHPLNKSIFGKEIKNVSWNEVYKKLDINFKEPVEKGIPYKFTLSGLRDCAGNLLKDTSLTFVLGDQPAPYELLISEILPDENPSIDLPEEEFIELFNASSRYLTLDSLYITDNDSKGYFKDNIVIEPGKYLIITKKGSEKKFFDFGRVIGITNFPSLNNDEDHIFLKNNSGKIIHEVHYKNSWYKNDKLKDGRSLELINYDPPCYHIYNWKPSVMPDGGTPGYANSVLDTSADVTQPLLKDAHINGFENLLLRFNESLDTISIQALNFSLEDNSIAEARIYDNEYKEIALTFSQKLKRGVVNTLKITGISDCNGNKMRDTLIRFGMGKVAKHYDIVISEIYADESPSNGLPDKKFAEIYNTTDDVLFIDNLIFTDGNAYASIPSGSIIYPGEYIVLTSFSGKTAYQRYGKTIALENFPFLNKKEDHLQLLTKREEEIHAVSYSSSWYSNSQKAEGGWSLEMVDTHNPCEESGNWNASIASIGGTPGKINSIEASNPDIKPPQLLSAYAINKDKVMININEKTNNNALKKANFNFKPALNIKKIKSFDNGFKIHLSDTLIPSFEYQIEVGGLEDCIGNTVDFPQTRPLIRPEIADSSDVVINEILFNPVPGGVDYVEIYNLSEKYLNLQDWFITSVDEDSIVDKRKITDKNFIFKPDQYLALTNASSIIKNHFPDAVKGNFLKLKNMPSFNDDKDGAVIMNAHGQIFDILNYEESWHHPLIDNPEGVSLERISAEAPASNSSNWHSAASTSDFGTPGLPNSQGTGASKDHDKIHVEPQIFSPDQDGYNDFTRIHYQFKKRGNSAHIFIFNEQGRKIRQLANNYLLSDKGFIKWDGTDNYGRKVPVGNYIIYVQIFHFSGEVKEFKKRVVVAGWLKN